MGFKLHKWPILKIYVNSKELLHVKKKISGNVGETTTMAWSGGHETKKVKWN